MFLKSGKPFAAIHKTCVIKQLFDSYQTYDF